jgi:hypothetical protein
VPQFAYPRDLVLHILEHEFGCDIQDEQADEEGYAYLVVTRAGNLFTSVLGIEVHEVLRYSLQVAAGELKIDFTDLLAALDREIQHRLDHPDDQG